MVERRGGIVLLAFAGRGTTHLLRSTQAHGLSYRRMFCVPVRPDSFTTRRTETVSHGDSKSIRTAEARHRSGIADGFRR